MKVFSKILLFLLLTVITQIGGFVLVLTLWIRSKFKSNALIVFISLYLISTLLIVPLIAPILGREVVKNSHNIEATSYLSILLNRNYVKPQLNKLLSQTANNLKNSNIKIKYLDASFPFIDKFPLLPHLSHNDGKKIDISFVYEDSNGMVNEKKSLSGYGIFVPFKKGEYEQTKHCKSKGFFQYDFPKYLTFGKINEHLVFSEKGTKILIDALLKNRSLGKLFIEPNLKKRLGLRDHRVRNHGCHAVRHDDHIHIQLR